MIALREVVKAPPQLVFRLYTEAGVCVRWRVHAPRTVIDKLDLRAGRRYRFVHHAPDGQQLAFRGAYLEKAGVPVAVRGAGMLFDDRQPDGNKTKER